MSVQTLSKTLRNAICAGRLVVEKWGIRQKAKFDPIVAEDVFNRAQAVLDGKRPSVTPYARNIPPSHCDASSAAVAVILPLPEAIRQAGAAANILITTAGGGCTSATKADLETAFVEYTQRLQPEPALFNVFREVVVDVWKERNQEARTSTVRITRRIADLWTKKSRMVDLLTRGTLDEKTLKAEAADVDGEILVGEIELREGQCEELDVEVVLNFARDLLSSAGKLWKEFDLDRKQRLQKVLFPEGLRFADGKFWNRCNILRLQ